MKANRRLDVLRQSFLTLTLLKGDEKSASGTGRFISKETDLVSVEKLVGWTVELYGSIGEMKFFFVSGIDPRFLSCAVRGLVATCIYKLGSK